MRKVILFCLVLAFLSLKGFGQEDQEKQGFDKSKLFFGGYLGLSFGSYVTAINVTPQVGYMFNQYVAAGVGINYAYYSYKNPYPPVQTETYSYLGMNIFGRIYPIRQFFIQVQPEVNYIWGNTSIAGYGESKIPSQFVPSLLLGGGAALPAGKGAVVISVMYDVIQNTYSPYYGQAVYSFGYNFAF